MLKHALLIFLVCLFLTVVWFGDGKLKGGGEEGVPFYNLQTTVEITSSIWRDSNTGYPTTPDLNRLPFYIFLKIFHDLGIPGVYLQALTNLLLMSTGAISMYLLLRFTIHNKNYPSLVPLMGSLFYLLNPYSMSQVWGRGLYMQSFPFALFPLYLFLFIRLLQTRQMIYLFLGVIASFLLAGSFGNPSYVISMWFLTGLYLAFHIGFFDKDTKSKIVSLILFINLGLIWSVTHLWWILPYLSHSPLTSSINSPESTRLNLDSLVGVSAHFPPQDVIRLIQTYVFYIANSFGSIYSSFPFLILSWVIPLVSLFSLKFIKKDNYLKFFFVLFVISYFVSLGANPPLGWLFTLFFQKISILQSFRNPYEKFGIVFLIAYVPFFALGLYSFSSWIARRYFHNSNKGYLLVLGMMLILINIYLWPMWTGRVIREEGNRNRFYVPEYYEELSEYIDLQRKGENSRLIVAPIVAGDGVGLRWGDSVYAGVDPYLYFLRLPTLSNTLQLPGSYDLMVAFRKNMPKMDTSGVISLLRGKYLMLRDDVVVDPTDLYQKDYLLKNIYPPAGPSGSKQLRCTNQLVPAKIPDGVWVVCMLDADSRNWEQVRYIHLEVKTDVSAVFEVAIRDVAELRPRWDGRNSKEYYSEASQVSQITLPLEAPSEGRDKFNSRDVRVIEILAHGVKDPVKDLQLSGIFIDKGIEQSIDNYDRLESFGQLTLYENKQSAYPPEFGVLQNIVTVDTVNDAFPKSNEIKGELDSTGIFIRSQNKDFKIDNEVFNKSRLVNSEKIAGTLFWIETEDSSSNIIILSKTYDTGWKIIPNIKKNELNNLSISDLWGLTKRQPVDESQHFILNGYANGWLVDSQSKQFGIIFMPEVYQLLGWKISTLVITLSAIFCLILIITNKISKRKVVVNKK